MLGLLSGLGKGALEGKYEQRLLERKRFEEFQKQHMEQQLKAQELLPDEKEYISNVPRYQRAIDLAYEKLGAAEGALPDSRFSRLLYGDKINSVMDLFRDESKVNARNEFGRYLEGELLPAIMQIEGLPINKYSVEAFKEKFDVNKLSAKSWRKFFDETREKLDARAGDIQKKIRGLNETQLGQLMQDPQIQATVKEEATRKLDSQIEGLSDDELDTLIKFSGNPEIINEPPEIKKNFFRELGLQMIADIPAVAIGATLGAPLGPIGMFIGGSLGGLVGAYAGTAAERGMAGDPNALSNAFTDTKEDAALILAAHGLGNVVAKGGKAVTGLFKQGREPVRNVVSRGFDTAIKDVPDIKVNDVGKFLKSATKETNNPFQRIVAKDLAKKFSSKDGNYTSKEFADILSGLRESSRNLAKKYDVPENQIRDVVSKLEEHFLPLRANVSKTMGLLSGASSALEKGNVRKVAEVFGELPEKIAIDNGVFTKDQVIRGFLLENADAIRNKFIAPVASEKLTEFANKTGWFGHLSGGAIKEVLAQIGLNGFADGKIAKLFAQYSFGSAKDPVTRELLSALQGKIIEEQSGFILEMLKKAAMSGGKVALRGRVKGND
ncbi:MULTISPECIES: QueT transporter family protein [Wolbachia]|uniref:QueT transporter family protein n=1 Tax=Wolbachia TaxID=953 RepID=UPI001ABE3809|nr:MULTISPECIES: QueT transporter family protein [Wolbachia]MDE5063658.1 QueT transporter family protein [Wolbachia endosymbiont of Drosophila chauvacae]MDE5059743.1 QueT transporter family protein [Wolbachia endosymbiont of Drosophila burlai]MDE5064815.1 QueT transporter family protein [Wolbachia endosymbiont of Drosophila tristis]MDU8908521.1 QueT transporter family protein [Wolbachia endosymbiont of Drosophila bocqueti]MDU8920408.1 QueT transporter family protein [Wolbachia endosymbiont of 